MLTRASLFGDLDTSTKLLARVQETPVPLALVLPQSMAGVESVLQRALAHNPDDRFATASDFAHNMSDVLLPDRQRKRGLVISDPLQIAQVRAVRQTITGFLWGIAAIVLLVLLFSSALFLRGYVSGSTSLFVWDGVIVRQANGLHYVSELWPGSTAGRAGIQIGDQIKDDLFSDYMRLDGDYTVNGQPRAVLPVNWEPHLGDVIQRTVLRNGQPVVIQYAIERSWYAALLLIAYSIPAGLAFACVVWLLRRWGPEPGVRIIFPLLLSASFLLLTQALARVIPYMDTVAAHIVLPSLLLFVLNYPEPLPILKRHRWLTWALYIPLIGPLIEFLLNSGIPIGNGIEIQLLSYIGYGVAIIIAIVLKWVAHDVKYYHSLPWLIIGFLLVPLTVIPNTLINALNFETSSHLFGGDVNVRLIALMIAAGGGSIAAILIWIGYHRLQSGLGLSFILNDAPSDEPHLVHLITLPVNGASSRSR